MPHVFSRVASKIPTSSNSNPRGWALEANLHWLHYVVYTNTAFSVQKRTQESSLWHQFRDFRQLAGQFWCHFGPFWWWTALHLRCTCVASALHLRCTCVAPVLHLCCTQCHTQFHTIWVNFRVIFRSNPCLSLNMVLFEKHAFRLDETIVFEVLVGLLSILFRNIPQYPFLINSGSYFLRYFTPETPRRPPGDPPETPPRPPRPSRSHIFCKNFQTAPRATFSQGRILPGAAFSPCCSRCRTSSAWLVRCFCIFV